MSYRPTSPELAAIGTTSLAAGAIGAMLVALFFTFSFLTSHYSTAGSISAFPLIFFVALIPGVVFSATCLLLFGLPVAKFAGKALERRRGIAIALLSAIGVSVLLAALVFEPSLALLSATYAIPAAIIYRREVLLERALDEV